MKVLCQGNELSDALSKVVKALPVKRNNPILDSVKLTAMGDTLTVFATDLELAIEKKINAQVLIEGEIVVPGKLFADYAKKIESEQIELDGTVTTKLTIKYLDSELQINCMSADEYPVFNEVSTENSIIILKKEFKDIISKVIFDVASDDGRPNLRGVCLNVRGDIVEAVASDGYRLAIANAQVKNNGVTNKIIIPTKSISELSKLIDDDDETVTIYVEKNYVMVDLFHTKLVTRLISEDFLSYEKIIPSSFGTVATIDKKIFESAVERVSLINRIGKNGTVKMDIKEGSMLLNAKSDDGEINEKVVIGLNGKDLMIGFNPKYIMDCMKVIDEPFITFNFNTSTSPAVIKGESGRWEYLILPLRVIG
ncbi:MAG: DNA polymerase III subunit beta [Clostridiales bacterium]|nr:DNA polymerase III subunit beta [Clostridiales bacterium]